MIAEAVVFFCARSFSKERKFFMAAILTKAGCFVAIILLGWILRRVGFFKEGDFGVLSKIVLRITLPASIIYSFSDKQIDPAMLLLSVLGFLLGIGYIGIGFLISLGKSKEEKAFSILNISGYNIGNFTLPFAQSFLGPAGVVTTSLFDTGNAFICLGVAYSVAAMVLRGEKFSPVKILRDLLKSVPFVTYITMALLALVHFRLPSPITELAGLIGNANAPMAMLMLGVGFKISGDSSQVHSLVKILSVRYAVAAAVSLGCFFLLPVGLETRQTLALLAFSPIASAAPAFTGELGGDSGLASAVNSISIVISLVCIVGVLLLRL